MENDAVGGGVGGSPVPGGYGEAPKGKRFLCSLIDLIGVPMVLGFAFGLLLLLVRTPDGFNTFVLIAVNIAWMIFRDVKYSPGRALLGLRLVSLEGSEKITLSQALIRNVLLIIPGLLLLGYPIELIAVFFVKGGRVMDGPAKTKVVAA